MLALLLARQGIAVTLLEAHLHFEHPFRGDSLHPSVLEILEDLGLAEQILKLPHTKIQRLTVSGPALPAPVLVSDLSHLPTRHPYILMVSQARFLEQLIAEAQRSGCVRVALGARAEELIEEAGTVRGVRYRGPDGWHSISARLVVAADGRFSRLRRLAGLPLTTLAAPVDVLWFALPRRPSDDPELAATVRLGYGSVLVLLDHGSYWQAGYVIPKDAYQQFRQAGLEAFQQRLLVMVPEFAEHVRELRDWRQIALLSVEVSRLRRWCRPGLLLIGDAAHVMSPLGGIGINYAIQDAVVAANLLAQPLSDGTLRLSDLELVQRERYWPTRITQSAQGLMQRLLLAGGQLQPGNLRLPLLLGLYARVPLASDLITRLIALGIRPARVR
jgi:2-polyprenyl-6-methoxyphenol hydroxylase-like FAD-dependent oxidoreductase